jgi:histone H3/H4
MDLPLAPIERIMRDVGAERISDEAVKALANILKDNAQELTEDAIAMAKHANRKTITAEDIRMAKRT